jgi:hypothetical protein
MNPGAIEEGSKTINSVVDALKSTPMTLALVLANFALLAFLFWNNHEILDQRRRITEVIAKQNQDVNKQLAECVPADIVRELLGKAPAKPPL